MPLFKLEQSRLAYRADVAFYVAAVLLVGVALASQVPPPLWFGTAFWTAGGVVAWSLVEYAVHRFVLHHVPPFRRWHEQHHDRPVALICAPTIFSASLIVGLIFLPLLALVGPRRATAITLGVLVGYLAYSVLHHAAHHWRGAGGWMQSRKRWHARHHHGAGNRAHFGVSTDLWDRIFGTAGTDGPSRPSRTRSAPRADGLHDG